MDTGIIIDAAKSYQPRNGNVFALTDYPHIAPNWMEATGKNNKIADKQPLLQYKIRLISVPYQSNFTQV